jgi:glycosyltransferase involved in cell wall biosynthesis
MRIVEVITSADWGGAQRHVYDLALGLKARGHEVVVLYGREGSLSALLRAADIEANPLPLLTRAIRPWQDFHALRELRQEIFSLRPDVVHVHSSKAGVLVRVALRAREIPVVYTIHGLVYLNERMVVCKRTFYRLVEWALLPRARATITVSQCDFHALARSSRSRRTHLVHIANGIAALPALPLPEEPVIGTVARFTEEKALDLLLEAVARIRAVVPAVRLLLVGDGPLRPALEQQARDLALDDRTQFVGFQTDVVPWLAHMRIFALTSVKEGMPYALLEAISAERIVVASNVGGVQELGTIPGLIRCQPGQVDALVEALTEALDPAADPVSAEGLATAEAMCAAVEQVLKEAARR